MWIDTHCHLDASEFDADRLAVADAARQAGVRSIVIPAVARSNFATVRALAQRVDGAYALGIHPLATGHADERDLDALRDELTRHIGDPRLVAVGEIGLDYFVADLDDARQRFFFDAQLRLARDFDLPAICHIRRSQDLVLQGLRRFAVRSGIAHAFNGSRQQADGFIAQGFALGFGGAMTFPRALQIRRLAAQLPPEAIVVETDAPDIPPEWQSRQRNSPEQIPRIAGTLVELRQSTPEHIAALTTANAQRVLPRLVGRDAMAARATPVPTSR